MLIYHEWTKRIAHSHSLFMSDLSDSLMVVLLIWATWSICSQLLICLEQSQQIAYSCSFDLSDLSKWANEWWVNERWANERWVNKWWANEWIPSPDSMVCITPQSLTLWYDAHRRVWLRSVHHTAELDYFKNDFFCAFKLFTSFNYIVLKNAWNKKDSWNKLWLKA